MARRLPSGVTTTEQESEARRTLEVLIGLARELG